MLHIQAVSAWRRCCLEVCQGKIPFIVFPATVLVKFGQTRNRDLVKDSIGRY